MRVLTSIRLTQFGGLSVRQASKMVRPRSVTGDGEGLVSRGGLVWLGEVADHDGQVGRDFGRPGPGCFMMRPARADKPVGYILGSYRIATAPEPNSSRLTSFKSTRFDSPANNVGPWPTSLGCTTNSYSSINPSSANARGSFTPPTNSPLPDCCLSC